MNNKSNSGIYRGVITKEILLFLSPLKSEKKKRVKERSNVKVSIFKSRNP
ncbi:MAG: hypothetical protein Q7J67_04880 [bacterium]|nr:hypothetical protein [bacterium]